MCTVSVVSSGEGFRMVCNRDEQRTRPAAMPPAIHRVGTGHAIWPTDPQSGGTWIGVNENGLAMVLLNRRRSRTPTASLPTTSRGTIIPKLLQSSSPAAAVDHAAALPLDRFEPFTLAIVQREHVVTMTSDGGCATWSVHSLTQPMLLTSSSLDDRQVIGPRRRLFARLVTRSDTPLESQDRFHRHSWPTHPEISVQMSRADAATVSRTILDVTARAVSMRYAALEA